MSAPDLSKTFSARMLTAMFWLSLMGMLTLFFNGYIDRRDNPNKALAITAVDNSEVVLQRNRSGHYVAPGAINGYPVTFLLDTGATDVSIPKAVARKAGLEEGRRTSVSTANGVVDVYQVELDSVQLGGITIHDVHANINPHVDDDVVLLGMSFMKHLEIIQRDRMLTLRVPVQFQ